MKRVILCFLLSNWYLFSFAQGAEIKGTVMNKDESIPVHNAVISLITPSDSTIF